VVGAIKVESPADPVTPDWERIEADYRAGLLSLRAIAARDGHVTEAAIRKRARKLDWARDLTARVHARAEELVRRQMVRKAGAQYATASEPAEAAIVEDNAQLLAGVELTQRRDISRARAMVATLFAELDEIAGERAAAESSQHLLAMVEPSSGESNGVSRARGALSKATSLPVRAATVKALADALRTLVALEREVWGLDSRGSSNAASNAKPRTIDPALLSDEERAQLRAICEKATALKTLPPTH